MKRVKDLIVIAFGWPNPIDMKDISPIIGIKSNSLERYIHDLLKEGLLSKGGEKQYSLTKMGREKYETLIEEISHHDIIPGKHNVSKVSKLRTIKPSIGRVETMLTLTKAIWNDEAVNVIELIQRDNALRQSSFVNRWIDEMINKDGERTMSEDQAFRDLTMLGTKSEIKCREDESTTNTLILADLKRRQSHVQEALEDFYCMLNRKSLIPGHWIVAKVGWIYCINILKDTNSALAEIQLELKSTLNPSHKAWFLYLKADILSDDCRYFEANDFFLRSLAIMRSEKLHVSMTEVLNSYGVNLFRMGMIQKAEKQWIKSRKLCITYNLPRMKSIVDINLSDIWSKNGNFRRAHDNLRKAEQVLIQIGDFEGVSGVSFNRALLYVREGKIQKAQEFFYNAESYPLVYDKKRKERREVYNKCLEENGYPPVRDPI